MQHDVSVEPGMDTLAGRDSVCFGCDWQLRCAERNLACKERYNEVRGFRNRKADRSPKAHTGGLVASELVSIARRKAKREYEASRPAPVVPYVAPVDAWAARFLQGHRNTFVNRFEKP